VAQDRPVEVTSVYQIGAGREGGPLIFPLLAKEGVRGRLLSGGLRSDLGDLRARQAGADQTGEVGRIGALPAATPALYALEAAAAVLDDVMAAPVHDPAEATRPPLPLMALQAFVWAPFRFLPFVRGDQRG